MADSCPIVFWIIVMLLQTENHLVGTKNKMYTQCDVGQNQRNGKKIVFLSQAVKKKRPKDKKCSSEAKYETITVGSSRLLHSTFICHFQQNSTVAYKWYHSAGNRYFKCLI